jgi:hypothetical protein
VLLVTVLPQQEHPEPLAAERRRRDELVDQRIVERSQLVIAAV